MSHTLRVTASVLAVAALLAAAPASAQLRATPELRPAPADSRPRSADYIVAVVNSEPITNHEVRTRALRFEQQLRQDGQAVPPRAELLRLVLERLISERAQLQLARDSGVRVDEAMINQAEANFAAQNNVTVEDLRRRLSADGIPAAAFREDLRNQLLLLRLRDREVESRVRVSDLEVEQYLREQQSTDSAVELNLAQVLVAVPENAPPSQVQTLQARAETVQRRASAGEDFAALAREFSDAPGASSTGGQMGLRPADRYPELFVEAVKPLQTGAVTGVLRSGAGFHVLKVVERRAAGMQATTVTQTHARHILLRPTGNLTEVGARRRLEEFRQRVQSGQADFAALAREHSQDASASRGGDLGWVNPGTFVPEFEEALARLSPGQVSEPIVSRFGVHLIQLLDRREAALGQREQREIVRNMLREKKLDDAYVQWAQDVRGRAYVDFREPPT
jgi:peptidyl-prolyl cis-trans isomerase SurA